MGSRNATVRVTSPTVRFKLLYLCNRPAGAFFLTRRISLGLKYLLECNPLHQLG